MTAWFHLRWINGATAAVVLFHSKGYQCRIKPGTFRSINRNIPLDQNDHFSPEAVTSLYRSYRYKIIEERSGDVLCSHITAVSVLVPVMAVY
ncbi:hypothetical protein TNCV_2752861 [Trichonephila clavipes]|nr:hypothetical protein TNCV_2752861 [Trichonephila clavipes]